jgi:predicted transposase/invertase (TIGR01784 family)
VLRNKANFDVLEGFLTALLKEDITILEILESEGNQLEETVKFNRVDLLVKDSKNRKIIIEIQNDRETDYLERLLFGTSKIITDTLELGRPYGEISKVISISILYFELKFGDDYLYYGQTQFKGIHSGNLLKIGKPYLAEKPEIQKDISTIFPEYYLIDLTKFADIIKEDIDEWIYMFKHSEIQSDFKAKNIKKAEEKLNIIKMNEAKRKAYEHYVMSVVSEVDVIETAKAESFKKGEQKGEQIGIKKGEQIGIKKGKIEEKADTIKNMHAEGLSLALISRVTGLTIDKVKKILG